MVAAAVKCLRHASSGPYLALAADCLSTSITGSLRGEEAVWEVIQAAAVSSCLPTCVRLDVCAPSPSLNPAPSLLTQSCLSSLFATCLDFLVKDDVSAADALLLQVFDVCIGSSTSLGSSSSKVAIIDCMRTRCCSPCVSICPYIQVGDFDVT